MSFIDPNQILFNALCGYSIADDIINTVLKEIQKTFHEVEKEKLKKIENELRKNIEVSLREKGPSWLKQLIKKQDEFQIKH